MKKKHIGALVSIVALALSACGPASDEAQITALVNDMFAAMKEGNFEKMKELVAEENQMVQNEAAFKMAAAMMQNARFELSNIKVDGDTATATLKITVAFMGQEQSNENEATFKKINGRWKSVQ